RSAFAIPEIAAWNLAVGITNERRSTRQCRSNLRVELAKVDAREIQALQLGDGKSAAVRVLRGVGTPGLADLTASLLIDEAGQVRVDAAERLGALEAGHTTAEDGDAA